MLLLIGLPNVGLAAGRSHGMVTRAELALRGTWYSGHQTITFRNNGTTYYKGKRYFYAVSNGGFIELSRKNSSNAIQYQLAGGKLTLSANGNSTVYTRKRPRGK